MDHGDSPPPRRKSSKQGDKEKKKENDDNSDQPPPIYKCRFCDLEYDKAQALGGHMNRHRQEREREELQKAKELVVFGRGEQHFGGPMYNMPGGVGAGLATLNQGGNNMMPYTSLVGPSSRQYYPSNQQPLQNWQYNQPLQSSYSFESQSHVPGGSFYSSQDTTQPQAPQLRVNPGQGQMAQRQVQPAADFGSHGLNTYQTEPSPLDEVVRGSNRNNVTRPSITPRSASPVNLQYPYINTRLAPSNEAHFQHTSPDQYRYLNQRPGSSALGGLELLIPGYRGLHMQSSFQDSTDHIIQDDYQGGNDVGAAAGARTEPPEPDGTEHIQDDYQGGNDGVDAAATSAGIEGSEPDGASSDKNTPQ